MIRWVYLRLSQWWGDEPIPVNPDECWPKRRLQSSQTWSRYFLVGNLIRAGTISPVVGYLSSIHFWLPLLILVYPLAVHLLLTVVEIYKQALIHRLIPLSDDEDWTPHPKYPDLPNVSRKTLRLLPFESVRLYQLLGMEAFRTLVMWYVSEAMGKARQVRYMDRTGRRAAIDYAMEASTAESVHAKGAALNTVVLALIFSTAPVWINVWLGFWVFAEWCLVLLQRYMRVRVFVALTKRHGRP